MDFKKSIMPSIDIINHLFYWRKKPDWMPRILPLYRQKITVETVDIILKVGPDLEVNPTHTLPEHFFKPLIIRGNELFSRQILGKWDFIERLGNFVTDDLFHP